MNRIANIFRHSIYMGILLAILCIPLFTLTKSAKAGFASGDWPPTGGGGGGGINCTGHGVAYYPDIACTEYWIYMKKETDPAKGGTPVNSPVAGIWGQIGGTYSNGTNTISLDLTSATLTAFKGVLDNKCSFADGYFIFNISSHYGRVSDTYKQARLAIHGRTTSAGTFLTASSTAGDPAVTMNSFTPTSNYVLTSNTIYSNTSVQAAFNKAASDNGVAGANFNNTSWFCYDSTQKDIRYAAR